MQDLAVMDMLDGQCHLDEPVEDLIFTVANSSNFLLISNLSVQIAAISVVHDDTQAALVHEGLLVGDDIRVPHGFEYVDLIYGVFTLLTVHF